MARAPIPPYAPTFNYSGKQILIDSDRITLNSKEDTTFLLGKKAISISTQGTVNIDSKGMTIINSPQIYLGLNATHPLVYGDELVKVFKQFFLLVTNEVIPQLLSAQIEGSPVIGVTSAAEGLNTAVQYANDGLDKILSTTNFTQ
tara:strand:+ start:727 stop:1161 length:435 start_codon:yes stop_codon:yes gene_type:complete